MTDIKDIFLFSYRELKKVRTITTVAMFVALSIILGAFTVPIGNFLKIGFSSLTTVSVGYLFGPIVGSVFGAITDVVKYAIKPTGPFFPGFTLNAIIAGFIYGSILYKKQVEYKEDFYCRVFCKSVLQYLTWHTLAECFIRKGFSCYFAYESVEEYNSSAYKQLYGICYTEVFGAVQTKNKIK
ncbi:hypothetical protein HMPREF9099_01202 [Lachnospiraceae bacterium oral taxon 082 str. F0431]|nr:hypothetical protein HMPREF9099_01202 [Lachnospiraceae bacterium oral taxon 082 str. F0431]